jgi:hypothetical protein
MIFPNSLLKGLFLPRRQASRGSRYRVALLSVLLAATVGIALAMGADPLAVAVAAGCSFLLALVRSPALRTTVDILGLESHPTQLRARARAHDTSQQVEGEWPA